jgi:hypothetical protein
VELLDVVLRKRVVEDGQFIEAAITHVEIQFLGFRTLQIQFRANSQSFDSFVSVKFSIRLRVNFNAVAIETNCTPSATKAT